MPEHLRALLVILVLSAIVLSIARPGLIQLIDASSFNKWRGLWFFTAVAWFLTPSFWIYTLLMISALKLVQKHKEQIFALYFLLIFAAPAVGVPIPGFGLIDHLFSLDHYRLLALVMLLPASASLIRDKSTPRLGQSPVDWLLVGYLTLTWVLSLKEASLTNGIRMAFLQYIDGFLPYYVASRGLKKTTDFKYFYAALLLAAFFLSLFAIFETLRGWKLYTASISNLGLFITDSYKMRGPFLRPVASVLDSIVLGTVILLAMGGLLYLKSEIRGRFNLLIFWLLLSAGLLASMSRAPWTASILLILLFDLQGPKAIKHIIRLIALTVLLFFVFSQFSMGRAFIDLLPYVGKSEQGSIEYRTNWLSASAPLIERNFWFGDVQVTKAPELEVMRQGEGIIDLVNTFLAVLLHYGVVGLFLFIAMFISALSFVKRFTSSSNEKTKSPDRLHHVLTSTVVSLMFILITLSMISVIPILIWTFLGLCSAYGLIQKTALISIKREHLIS